MKTRFDATACLAGALLWLACCAPALAFDLPELMATLGRQRTGDVRFTEQRYVSGLDAPLASSGILGFEPPDKLIRRVLQPRPESFAVDGNTLTLTRGGRSRSLALDSMPELLPLIEALRGTLSGDAARLQRYFRATLGGSADNWTLDLVPLDLRLTSQVRGVRIGGRLGQVLTIEMEFAGGDRSMMSIEPAPAKPASAP